MNFTELLTGKIHVGYIVEDAETALASVQEKLGCALDSKTYFYSPDKAWQCGVPAGNIELKIAMCHIMNNVWLEYLQPTTKEGFHYMSKVLNGEHINHVGFSTDDYDHYRREFVAMGATFLYEGEANDPKGGYRRCFYAKLEGIPNLIEVLENAQPYRPE